MFAYDFTNNRCVQFTYGGCGGNPNRFHTKEACQIVCDALPDEEDEQDFLSTEKIKIITEHPQTSKEKTEPNVIPSTVRKKVTSKMEKAMETSTLKENVIESIETFTLFNFKLFN